MTAKTVAHLRLRLNLVLLALVVAAALALLSCTKAAERATPAPLPAVPTSSTESGSAAAPVLDSPAPAFSLPASDGKTVSLADFAGKQDVLLYFNMAYG